MKKILNILNMILRIFRKERKYEVNEDEKMSEKESIERNRMTGKKYRRKFSRKRIQGSGIRKFL